MAFLALELENSRITPHDTPQVDQLVMILEKEMSREMIQEKMGLSDRKTSEQII